MTLDEALAKLGLSRGASTDQARRAYLRLLKTTRPEVDRDEFIALRNAYEVLRTLIPLMAHLEAARIAPVDPPVSDANATESVTAAEGAQTIVPEPVVPDSAPPTGGSSFIAGAPTARLELPAGEAALRMCELFDRAGHDPSAILPVVEALRLTLNCLAKDEVASALALNKKVSAWIQRSGRETSLDPALLTIWVTVRELAELAPVVSPRVFAPIAKAVLEDGLAQASHALTEFRVERPQTALAALAQMKQKAPWLAATVGSALAQPPRPPPTKRWTINPSWFGAPGSVIVYIIFRIIAAMVTPSGRQRERENREWTPPAKQAWINPQSVEMAMKADAGSTERLKRALGLFFQLTESVAETMKSCQMASAETLVRQVHENVRNGNCAMAEAPMSQLRDLKAAYPPEEWGCASEHVLALDRSFTIVCAEAQRILPPRKPE